MASIDERVVAMAFENQVFEQRAAQTMTTLGKLDTALKNMHGSQGFDDIEKSGNKVTLSGPMAALDKLRAKLGKSGEGAAQGLGEIDRAGDKVTLEGPNRALDKTQAKMNQLSAGSTFSDIEKASNQVELSGITKAIDNVSNKFGLLQNAASVAIGGIASNAAMKGASFGKSFAFGPIQDGLSEYSTNLNSIQTILANTQGQQVSGLDQVNKHLGELNTYSDKTIYSFSEMAKNIGTFTAAGVDMDKSTQSIKGIANLAALSGSNSVQASSAMLQLSQAIASGRVGLQDWNSVVNAGMGGSVFQKALMRTAENMGSVEKGAVKIDKATGKATVNGQSFRESIQAKPGQQSWLTSDVLVNTLGQLTGDMTDAQLAAQGFTTEQIKSIQTQAKTAQAAATEVKTLPQVFDVARETIGSGWAQTFQLIFGDFNQSKKTFTEMSNFINNWINSVSKARNAMLAEWSKLGGRDELIGGIKQAFSDLVQLIKPIQDAFREVFPPKTGKDLFAMTKSFHELMDTLRPSPAVISTIRSAFRIFFDVLDIGWHIIKEVAGVIGDLLGVVGKGQGGFAKFIGGVSQFIDSIHDALIQGKLLSTFFDGLEAIIKKPLGLLTRLKDAIAGLFGKATDKPPWTQQMNELQQFGKVLTPTERLINKFKDAWKKLVDGFDAAKSALEPWFSLFMDKLSGLGKMIGDALSNLNFDDVMKGVQTGLLAGLIVMIKNLFGKGGDLLDEVSKTLGSVQKLLGGVSGQLEVMEKKVQAETILAIAGAVLALAAGVLVLSTIDGKKLTKAMSAVAVGLGELMGAMKLMQSGMGKFGALQLPIIAAGLIGLSIAVTILAGAMKIFGTMSWGDIAKGLAGVAGSLGVIAGAMRLMPTGPQMIVQAAALLIIGAALSAIGSAVKIFASMKWEDLGKGLFGLVDALGIIALTMGMMPPNMVVTAASILILSFALVTLSGAIKAMGAMDLATLVKGIGGVAAALVAIGVAMWLMPPDMLLIGAGLLIVGAGLVAVAKSIEIMGNMGVWGIIKGLAALAGALVILSVGLYLMVGTLPGSLALLAASSALAVLAPTLGLLGNMSWGTIFKGLAAVALALGVIATVGIIAAPALAALGIALIPLGLGFLLIAGAAKLFASAMSTLADTGSKGIAAFLLAITGFIAVIPGVIVSLVNGLLSAIDQVQQLAPKVVMALGVILDTIIAFVIEAAPKLTVAIGALIDTILQVLLVNSPKIIAAGFKLLGDLLSGISQNIGQITDKVSEIIVKFLDALNTNMPKLVDAGSKTLRAFLNGVGSRFGEVATSVGNLIVKFIDAVGNQAGKITTAAANMMGKFVAAVATFGPTLLAKGAQVTMDFLEGLSQRGPEIIKKGAEVARKLVTSLANGLANLADVGFKGIIRFLNGLADAIRQNSNDLINAGLNVGGAIIDGVAQAFGRGGPLVKKALEAVFKLLPGWAQKILGIKSPSTVFATIGENAMGGFIKGVVDSKPAMKKSVEDAGKQSMAGMAQGVKDNQRVVSDAALSAGMAMVATVRGALGIHSPSEVFREIGMNVNHGFRDGLLGSRDDVISAFDSMNSSLIDKIRDLRSQVEDGNTKVEDLQKQHADKLAEIAKMRSDKKPDQSAIADAVKESQDLEKQINDETAAVNQNGKALTAARNIRASLTGSMKDEKTQLLALKDQYDALNTDLEDKTSKLNDLIRARADDLKKYQDQYDVKPDVNNLVSTALADADLTEQERRDKARKDQQDADKKAKIDQVALYEQALQEQLAATVRYQATLKKLQDLGLDTETYQKLLDEGVAGQDFADQLARSGKAGVDKVNALDAQLLAESTDLANQAVAKMYDNGIEIAKGLVKGLEDNKAALEAQMTSLADVMVNAIKTKLKIKSPSQIFAEIGMFTAQGLAKGMQGSTGTVTDAAASMGDQATAAIKNSLSGVLAAVGSEIDPTLTITPVLDMTQLQRDASQIKNLGNNVVPITAAVSYGQAASISSAQSVAADTAASEAAQAAPSFKFEQNNYSPESLSEIEIYRQTKNQFSQLKGLVGIS